LSGGPDDIVLKRLASEGTEEAIAFNASAAPLSAPRTSGAVIWSGYLYVPADVNCEFELSSLGAAWLWVDGSMVASNHFSDMVRSQKLALKLSKGYHAFKAKYFYPELSSASCSLSWKQGGRMVTVSSFYR